MQTFMRNVGYPILGSLGLLAIFVAVWFILFPEQTCQDFGFYPKSGFHLIKKVENGKIVLQDGFGNEDTFSLSRIEMFLNRKRRIEDRFNFSQTNVEELAGNGLFVDYDKANHFVVAQIFPKSNEFKQTNGEPGIDTGPVMK